MFYQIFYKIVQSKIHERSDWNKLTTKLAQIQKHTNMFDFYEANFEVKIRQNIS